MQRLAILVLIINASVCSHGQTVSFTYAGLGGTLCNPATVNFTSTTSEAPIGYTWSFGNGQFSNAANPSVVFAAGTYTVSLVAVFASQAVETKQTIFINPSISNTLIVDRNYICQPGNVNFTSTSSGNIASYEWDFGDGVTSINMSSTITHAYASFGSFAASVKAIDVSGCSAIGSQTITVQNPPIGGSVSPASGCIPATSNFTANITLPIGGSVTSYTWDFNDGSSTSSTSTHTYSAVGVYNPTVSIVTNEGCTNTFNYPTIGFGTPPTNHIAYPSKPIYCGSETSVFVAKANTANTYFWDYGDGVTETVTDTTTSHKYATLGVKNITVTPYFNGCAGSPINFPISIVGVIASFTYTNTCANKKTFTFANTSQGIISNYLWKFGDATATVNSANATHTYPASGAFTTIMTVTDNGTGCSDNASVVIQTANPTFIDSDLFLCRNASTTFLLQNNYQTPSISFTWSVLGLPNVINSSIPFTTIATNFGNFNNNYVVINNGSQYCADTITLNHAISVRGPNLSFNAPISVCALTNVIILNTSAAYQASDTVKLWYWNYGNSSINDTTYVADTLRFVGPGVYTVKLFAHDKNGCIDSLAKNITVKPTPFLRIFPRGDTLCLGQTDQLIAFHSDTLLWMPANFVSCTNCDTTIGSPTNTGYIYATATNNLNCVATDSTFILVYTPFIANIKTNPATVCLKDSVQISALPLGKKIAWSPLTGLSDPTVYSPFVSPQVTTLYQAVLVDSAGCFSDTTNVNVIVKTLPTVVAGPDKGYPYLSPFTITPTYSSNVILYGWSPIGSLNCTNCASPGGIADEAHIYTIKVRSDSGCVATDDIKIFVECKYANILVPSAFTPNRDGKNDIFRPITRGIKTITKFIVFNRYGQKLFEAKDFIPNISGIGWNGKVNGADQPPQTYVFLLTAICDSGEIVDKKDTFILIR